MKKLFNVLVGLINGMSNHCIWPVMLDRETNEYYFGSVAERWPTTYTAETLWFAVAWVATNPQVAGMQVVPVPDEDQSQGGGGYNACPGDVAARDTF